MAIKNNEENGFEIPAAPVGNVEVRKEGPKAPAPAPTLG